MESEQIFKGQCHCGALSFQFKASKIELIECNCSICKLKGFIHLIVPKDDFTLLTGAESIQNYQFNTKIAVHKFCKVCGIHPFYTPRSHPDCVDINANCINDFLIQNYEITAFDGENWEDNIQRLSQ